MEDLSEISTHKRAPVSVKVKVKAKAKATVLVLVLVKVKVNIHTNNLGPRIILVEVAMQTACKH